MLWFNVSIPDPWTFRNHYHKTFRPISVIDIYKLLPQTNCKECGFSTCLAFAGALSKKETTPDQCPGFTRPLYENAVYPIYDKNGNLATTVEIEVDTKESHHVSDRENESITRPGEKSTELKQNNNAVSQKNSVEVHTDLTDREIQVLCLVSEGATNTEIASLKRSYRSYSELIDFTKIGFCSFFTSPCHEFTRFKKRLYM